MQRLILTSLVSLLSVSSRGQVDILWSESGFSTSRLYESVYLDDYIYLVKVNTNGFSFSKKNNTAFYKYNRDMKEEQKSIQNLKFGSKKSVFTKLLVMNNKIYLLSTSPGSGGREIILNMISKSTLDPSGEKIEIINLKKEGLFNDAKFYVAQSPDKNMTLLIAQHDVAAKAPRKFQFFLINGDLKTILNETIELQGTSKKFKYVQTRVDNTGNIFFIGYQYSSKDDSSCAYLWRYLSQTNKNILDKITSPQKEYLKSIDFDITDDSIILGGFYSENNETKDYTVRGLVYNITPKTSGRKVKFEYIAFPSSVLHFELNERKQRKLEKNGKIEEYPYLETKKVLSWNDKYIIVAGEQIYRVRRNNESYEVSRNLIVSCLNKNGQLQWALPIKKSHQIDKWLYHHSFMISTNEKEIRIFYNNSTIGDLPEGMVMTTINMFGELKTKLIFNKKKEKILSCPLFCQQIKPDKYFIYGRNLLKDKLGILTISN